MTTIERISRIRDHGVFRDFTWDNGLWTFGKFNLIYGWNGTGKTTLSRIFRSLEARAIPRAGEVGLVISGAGVGGEEFPASTLPVRVFNRDFVQASVFPIGGSGVPPILVIGKENVEKHKAIDALKLSLDESAATLNIARRDRRGAIIVFDRHCIDRGTAIRETLRSAGTNSYSNYDKARYSARAMQMVDARDATSHLCSEHERDSLLAQQRALPKPPIGSITFTFPELSSITRAVADLLGESVVSAAIGALQDKPELAGWMHEGLRLHRASSPEVCLFCKQPLTSDRLGELEAHFNTEYELFLQKVDAQIIAIEAMERAVETLQLPQQAQFYDDLAGAYEAERVVFEEVRKVVKPVLQSFVSALKDKRGRPLERRVMSIVKPDVDHAVVERLNKVVSLHNEAGSSLQMRASDARKRLEAHYVAESIEQFVSLMEDAQKSEALVSEKENEVGQTGREIERLQREITAHHQSADELNNDLHQYLGHEEVRLKVLETGYAITRNGAAATELSEGEVTAIALLYFLKSLDDHRFDRGRGVVVLDDPVSSLDANALFLAFGFIRERTQGVGQLFILTHNFTLFRQVRNWFHMLPGQRKRPDRRPARFYMLECIRRADRRESSIVPLDPLLEEYESEYHYLFARIYRSAFSPLPDGLEQNYVLPNMARRLLEAFLSFRQPQSSGELWHKLKSVEFEEAKKLRILRFVHAHSHGNGVGEHEHDPSALGEAKSVLENLMELIESQDLKHYEAMVSIAKADTTIVGDEQEGLDA